ncbi:hypothetical protein ABIA71_002889 [Stenotrophomonas sp. 2619]|uniref:hypothetical protein n=1 Tax=Stenotrophomonas sp. 2619 TaxID=3156316 RepID=UPI00339800B5
MQMMTRKRTPITTTMAVLLACTLASQAHAARKAYDVEEVACTDPADMVCLSWNLQTAPGGSRTAGLNVTLMEGETISGVIKPKANRYTTTMLRTNPDLEMYIGMGFAPTEQAYTCKVTETENCRMSGSNLPAFHFKVKAKVDQAGSPLGYAYTTASN